ncbi:uncharacterized protein G2W53_040113 [Senna tora]|uniref:Uncharacterized protein n=1 Tax=Senna tora TaxID=362788 RepID=A0A834W3B9_9FABA|nr:uncharacterized protein G2W53_040113 [Senna tora]
MLASSVRVVSGVDSFYRRCAVDSFCRRQARVAVGSFRRREAREGLSKVLMLIKLLGESGVPIGATIHPEDVPQDLYRDQPWGKDPIDGKRWIYKVNDDS